MKGDGFSFRLTYFTCNIFFAVAFATALAPSFHAEEDSIFQLGAGQVVETVALVHFAVLPL